MTGEGREGIARAGRALSEDHGSCAEAGVHPQRQGQLRARSTWALSAARRSQVSRGTQRPEAPHGGPGAPNVTMRPSSQKVTEGRIPGV